MAAIPAQKLREVVLQILYSLEIAQADREELEMLLSKELAIPQVVIHQAYDRAKDVLNHLDLIDEKVASASKAYDPIRIPTVERSIIRLGIFEMFVDTSVPPKVAIAEAVRLTRKFSSAEAAAFVNAVLDCLYKQSLGEPTDDKELKESLQALKKIQEKAEEASLE